VASSRTSTATRPRGSTEGGVKIDTQAENCCCTYCRDLGFQAFDELREIVQDLDDAHTRAHVSDTSVPRLPHGLLDVLTERSKALERFMKYDFARKLKTASPNPRLCITFALTTANDKSFSKECTHGRSDDTVGEMPADFSAVCGGPPKMSNWNDDCCLGVHSNCRREAGQVMLCNDCNLVACKQCIGCTTNDWSKDDEAVIAFSQIRATMGDADELRILEHGHTEAGEGKCVVDMNCGQSKQDLSRDRDQGHDHECADEIFSGLERRPRAGDVNVVMAIDRTKEQEKKAPPLPRVHNYAHCTFNVDGSITCRECFGLGRGLTYTEAQLAIHDQHKVEDAIATATMESDAVVPKTQLSHAQKSEERAAKRRKKSARLDHADARRAADAAAVALEQGEDVTHECGACKRRFMTSGGLLKHAATCAGKRRSSRRGVHELMSDLAVEQDADLERERRELARVEVDLPVETSGLSFTEDVVSEVSGAAAASLKVGKGYVLRRVGSTDVGNDAGQAVATACAAARGDTITYVLERPAPPLPPHGWARKALRTTSRPRYTVEQKAFLDKHFESGLKGGERMRDKKVWKLMKAEFGRRVGENDKSLVLKQSQIRGYFSRRAAALKGSAVAKFLEDGDAAGDGGDGGDDYSKYKVSELREFLVRRGLDSDGLKQALVDRLREHDGTA